MPHYVRCCSGMHLALEDDGLQSAGQPKAAKPALA